MSGALLVLLAVLAALVVAAGALLVLLLTRLGRGRQGVPRAGEPGEEADPAAAARRSEGGTAWMRIGGGPL